MRELRFLFLSKRIQSATSLLAQRGKIAFLRIKYFHTAQHAVLLNIEPGSAVCVLLWAS